MRQHQEELRDRLWTADSYSPFALELQRAYSDGGAGWPFKPEISYLRRFLSARSDSSWLRRASMRELR